MGSNNCCCQSSEEKTVDDNINMHLQQHVATNNSVSLSSSAIPNDDNESKQRAVPTLNDTSDDTSSPKSIRLCAHPHDHDYVEMKHPDDSSSETTHNTANILGHPHDHDHIEKGDPHDHDYNYYQPPNERTSSLDTLKSIHSESNISSDNKQIEFNDDNIHFNFKKRKISIGIRDFSQKQIKSAKRDKRTIIIHGFDGKIYKTQCKDEFYAKYVEEKLLSFTDSVLWNIRNDKEYTLSSSGDVAPSSPPIECISISDCICTKRVIDAMIHYQSMDRNNDKQYEENLVKFCVEIYQSLLDDFIHVVTA